MDIRGERICMKFTLFGIKCCISVPFTVMLAFLLIVDTTGLMTASIFAVFVHEMGHIFAMRRLKCLPREVKFGFAGISVCGTSYCTYKESAGIALSGPIANLLIFALFYGLGLWLKDSMMLAFAVVQLIEGVVNLFPVKGLDGGTLLRVIVNSLNIRHKELIIRMVSVLIAIVIFVLGTAVAVKNVSNPSLLLLGIYLIIVNIMKFSN